MSVFRTLAVLAAACCLFAGCKEEGPAEKAGKRVDKGIENVKDASKDAVDSTKDAASDAANKSSDALDDLSKDLKK